MKEALRLKLIKSRAIDEISPEKQKEKESRRQRALAARGSYAEALQQAGVKFPPLLWVAGTLGIAFFLMTGLTKTIGPVVGLPVACCFVYYFLNTHLTAKAEKRRRQVVPQLPGFIDTLAASLATGYNMEAALEHATNSLPEGMMKKEFTHIVQMVNKNIPLDEAFNFLLRRISGQEMVSLVITIRLFHGMGGRVLTPFKRLGYKMREQQTVLERASRDLVGTKQAFNIIFFLSLTAPVFLLVSEPGYIMEAFKHPIIKYVMQICMVIQVHCFITFKRFTTLRV